MKGLKKIPSQKEIIAAVGVLEKSLVPAVDLVRFGQWARFDPRLAECWIENVAFFWKKINPVEFSAVLKEQVWPSSVGPLMEHLDWVLPSDEIDQFRLWKKCVLASIKPAPWQLYFFHQHSPGSMRQLAEAKRSLAPYSKWGYLCSDLCLNKEAQKLATSKSDSKQIRKRFLTLSQRKEVIEKLASEREKFTVNDYLSFLHHRIGRRQAERDLGAHPKLKKSGHTRSRFYSRTRKS